MVLKILFLFVIFLCKDQYDFSKAQVAAQASQGETTLALAQARNQDSGQESAAQGVWYPTKSSFARSSFSTLGSCRDGRIRCRLEMHGLLEDKQGQYIEVRSVRHQMDAWLRSKLCASKAPKEPETMELLRLERTDQLAGLGELLLGRWFQPISESQDPERQAQRQHTSEAQCGWQEREERPVQCARSGAAMECKLFWWTISHYSRRRIFGSSGEVGPTGDSGSRVQCGSESQCEADCGGVFHTGADGQGIEGSGGQDGQGAQKIEGCGEGETDNAFFVEKIHRRLLAKVDAVCRKIWPRRPRACRSCSGSKGETAENERRSRCQESCIRGSRWRRPHRHLRRGHGGEGGQLREHPKQHHAHGGEFVNYEATCGRSDHRGEREQGEETAHRQQRGWRAACWGRRLICAWVWSQTSRPAAFCQAWQVDSYRETCSRHLAGSLAAPESHVILGWNHSFVQEPEFQTPWQASIRGLDLAWEVGMILANPTPSSSRSLLRGGHRSTGFNQVTFAKYVEFYVGFEDTEHYAKETYEEECFKHQVHLCDITRRLYAESETQLEDEEASDEVSWMAARVPQDQGDLQPFLNRDAARAADMPAVAHQGDEIEVEIEAEILPADPEEVSGSETDSSESNNEEQEDRHSTLAYFMDYDPVHCRPRWRTYEQLHQDIAYQSRMSHHDVSRIHIIGHPPEDLQMASVRPVLVQRPQDVTEGSTFQLILLDVDFHNAMPSLEAETVRRAKLLPKTISRKALLAVLGLQPFCTYARQACLMWHNRKPVKAQSRALLDLRHGDYLKVVVPPGRGELRKFYTREVAQCMRRGYRASNIPVILEAYPEGIDVTDMPVYDTFAYVPKPEDLDYDKDAMSLFQMSGHSVPPLDPWPHFLTRSCEAPMEDFIHNLKVGESDRQEARFYETSNMTQPDAGRPQLAFGNEQHFLQEFFPMWHHFAAVEREDEGRILYAQTWYSDHDRFPTCEAPRSARLTSDISSWLDTLAETWDDRVDPDVELDFYLIVPRPRSPAGVGDPAVPHVLIVQHPRPDGRSVHVFAVDATNAGTTARSFTAVMPFLMRKSDFLDLLGIRDATFVESLVDCAVWHGDVELDHVQQYNIRHGLSFIAIQNHLRDIITRAAETSSASSSSRALLQVHQHRRVILLDELLETEEPTTQSEFVAVQVKWLAPIQPFPSYITLSANATKEEAAAELGCWGLKALPVVCNECGVVACLSAEPRDAPHHDYVFVNTNSQGGNSIQDVIVHTATKKLQTNELMSVLYQLGFWRAIIESEVEVYPQFQKFASWTKWSRSI